MFKRQNPDSGRAVWKVIPITLLAVVVNVMADDATTRLLLTEAKEANARHEIALEEEILTRALKAAGSPDDLAEAERRLAHLNWKFHQRYRAARQWLRMAVARGEKVAESWLERARLELAIGNYEKSRQAARTALDTAETPSERRQSQIAFARATVEEAIDARLEGSGEVPDSLGEAFAILETAIGEEAGDPEVARLLLTSALLSREGASALTAWRDYYHVGTNSPGPNLVSEAGRELAARRRVLAPPWREEVPLLPEALR